MKQVISAREVQELIRRGEALVFPKDALITPAARDLIRAQGQGVAKSDASALVKPSSASSPIGARGAKGSMEALYYSPEVEKLREEICDIGRRLWGRQYVDGNGGNISVRLNDELVLCTPTLVSKGFMDPEDLCIVDYDGDQKFGRLKRTSEILMHLEIMKAQPKARACAHAHPPYATAFAITGVSPPRNMIPEFEVFVGEVPVAPYDTPGTTDMVEHVAARAPSHNTILMANHGVVCWGSGVEDAYFKMEIVETYCRTVVVAAQLGKPPNTFDRGQVHKLMQIKESLGIPDPRIGLKEAELQDTDDWRPGVVCQAPPQSPPRAQVDPEAEAVVQRVTDVIMERLS